MDIKINISKDFEDYLKFTNRTIEDFYCRKCGKLMIDLQTLYDLKINRSKYKEITMKINPANHGWDTNIQFQRTQKNMYLILPKTFTNQIKLYRHTCWDCYLKDSWYKPYRYTKDWKNSIPSLGKIREDFSLIFDISTEQIKKITKQKYTTNSLEHFIKKFGEEKGKLKYEEYKKRQAYTASSQYFLKEKGMTVEEVEQYHKKRGHTLQGDIQKYGLEEGTKKWNEYCQRQAYAGVKLEYFIQKYGEEEGIKKWNKLIKSKVDNGAGSYSNISQQLFEQIKCEQSLFGKNELIFSVLNNDNVKKIYRLDFCNPSTKKAIQFNGVYWHAKPTKYQPDDMLKNRGGIKKKAKQIWEYDKQKLECAKQQGFDVLVIWEDDFRNNPNEIINECKNFLYN